MSARQYWTVRCDGTQGLTCGSETPVMQSLDESRAIGASRGWVVRRVKGVQLDLCASCSTVIGAGRKEKQ